MSKIGQKREMPMVNVIDFDELTINLVGSSAL
jgi:hypothetical protein